MSTPSIHELAIAGLIDVGAMRSIPKTSGHCLPRDRRGSRRGRSGPRYGSGILRSLDGGKTWAVLRRNSGEPHCVLPTCHSKIIVDPGIAKTIYAAVTSLADNSGSADDNGIYKSTDGGSTWTRTHGT